MVCLVLFFIQVTVSKHGFNGAPYNAMYFLSVLAVHILLWSKDFLELAGTHRLLATPLPYLACAGTAGATDWLWIRDWQFLSSSMHNQSFLWMLPRHYCVTSSSHSVNPFLFCHLHTYPCWDEVLILVSITAPSWSGPGLLIAPVDQFLCCHLRTYPYWDEVLIPYAGQDHPF